MPNVEKEVLDVAREAAAKAHGKIENLVKKLRPDAYTPEMFKRDDAVENLVSALRSVDLVAGVAEKEIDAHLTLSKANVVKIAELEKKLGETEAYAEEVTGRFELLAKGKLKTCDPCKGSGKTKTKDGEAACAPCGGSGWKSVE